MGALTTAKGEMVRAMFTRIAGRYDLMNSVMTGGRHHAWRRLTAAAVAGAPDGAALDLATGTADLALAVRAASPRRTVVGADFAEAMLRAAKPKLAARGERRVALLAADALALPFADKTFACVTSAIDGSRSAPWRSISAVCNLTPHRRLPCYARSPCSSRLP